jgi:hypothetical protein
MADVSLSGKRLLISAPPLLLSILELWHPTGSGQQTAFAAILPRVDWWLLLHLLQLPLFGLLGLSVILLGWQLSEPAQTWSRIGVLFFWIFYTALDSITGIAGGLLIRSARFLPADLQSLVAKQVNLFFFDPWLGGSTLSLLGALGAGGWLLGVGALAYGFSQQGVDRFTIALLAAAALMFAVSHTPPSGPFGLFLYFLATTRIALPEYHAQTTSPKINPTVRA